jgi:phosphoribosylglycinamide formyltransferase-1
MKRVAIFISGRGSNLAAILEKRKLGFLECQVPFVLSNRSDAMGLQIASQYKIPVTVLEQKEYSSRNEYEEAILALLSSKKIDVIVLAGFMLVLSKHFIETFAKPIINIHPALLPSFPGLSSQKRALDYGVKFTGCTVHFVSPEVDGGPIILQDIVPVFDDDTEESLTLRILAKEHIVLPEALKIVIEDRYTIIGRKVNLHP